MSVVTLVFEQDDSLVGAVEQPMATMHDDELRFYISRLAQECDRLEYLLMGSG